MCIFYLITYTCCDILNSWKIILDIIKDFEKSLDCIDDYDDFFEKIQIDKTSNYSQIKDYLNDYTKNYIYNHSKIKLKGGKGHITAKMHSLVYTSVTGTAVSLYRRILIQRIK